MYGADLIGRLSGDFAVLFTERRDDADQIASRAMDRIHELGLRAVPPTFTVWYAYFSGTFPDLTRAIDIVVSNRQTITDEHCADLYRSFFGIEVEQAAVRSAGDQLLMSIESVMASLAAAGNDATRYGAVLEDATGKLSIAATLEQIRSMIGGVAAETARMVQKNQALQSELRANAAQIETMRRDLEVVRKESLTDALTGIGNRKRFDDSMRELAGKAMNNGAPLCLMLVDIDHFKSFNDNHGHTAGDQVLKLVGRILAESVRTWDVAARYGGEEFGVLMPDTVLNEAVGVAERVRMTIAARKIVKRTTGESMGNITMSVGIARYRPGEPLTTFIQRADAALYQAKSAGRNRVDIDREDAAQMG